jgi:hypothetical protein
MHPFFPLPHTRTRAHRGRHSSAVHLNSAAQVRRVRILVVNALALQLRGRSGKPDRTTNRRAISGPFTSVTSGLSRSLADTSSRRSNAITGPTVQIPKLIVRVRFPSPAPQMKCRSGTCLSACQPANLAGIVACLSVSDRTASRTS